MGLFGGQGAQSALTAISAAFPDLEVNAEIQKQSFGKVLCVVVYGRTGPEPTALSADEARELAPRVWQTAKRHSAVPLVLSSVFDATGLEWLVNEHGDLETY